MGQGITVTGGEAVAGKLATLSKTLRNRIIRKAVGAGGAILRNAARTKAKARGYDVIAKSMGKKEKTYRGGVTAVSVIGPRGDYARPVQRTGRRKQQIERPAKIAHLVELGVAPHAIGKIKHPGHGPHPFMRPAYDEQKVAAQSAVSAKLAVGIEGAVK